MGKQWKQWLTSFWGAPKSLQMLIAAMKLKDTYSLEGKLWQRSLLGYGPSCHKELGMTEASEQAHTQANIACEHDQLLSFIWLFVTSWTVAYQAPLSMGFSRQEYWRGLPCPPPGDLPDPRIKPVSLAFPALAGRFFTTEPPAKQTSLNLQRNANDLRFISISYN